MTIQPDTLLTLVAPEALEENLVALLLAHPELSGGFTTLRADGHGATIALVGANENVRGRGRRVYFQLALARDAADQLLVELRQALPDASVFFWMVDLAKCGRLA